MPEPRPGAAPTPITTLGELCTRWHLTIHCGRCRTRAKTTAKALADQHGADIQLWRMLCRLRCHRFTASTGSAECRGKPSQVVASEVSTYGKSVRVVREITILNEDRRKITD